MDIPCLLLIHKPMSPSPYVIPIPFSASRMLILPNPWSNESNISPSSIQHSCSVKCRFRLTTYCTVLGAALCCFALFDGDQKCWESNQTFLCFRYCCAQLGKVLDSFDNSIELGRFALAQFHTIPEKYT